MWAEREKLNNVTEKWLRAETMDYNKKCKLPEAIESEKMKYFQTEDEILFLIN